MPGIVQRTGMPGVARRAKPGGADRGRTGGLMNAIHALYQLSYSPKNFNPQKIKNEYSVV